MKEQTWHEWLRACAKEGRHRLDLAMLTGQDARALAAIHHCWELYACSDSAGQRGAIAAIRALLPALQSKCQAFARELIAMSMDWNDRERLWPLIVRE